MEPSQESSTAPGATRAAAALAVFHQPPLRLNCAQSVAYAFAGDEASRAAAIEAYRGNGGGRTPGNECGALFVARRIVQQRNGDAELLARRFTEKLGQSTCRALRQQQVPCAECVRVAAELLQEGGDAPPGGKAAGS